MWLRRILQIAFFLLLLLASLCWMGKPGPTANAKLMIRITHQVGKQTLKLDSVHYQNELGQAFTISKFKYYLGHLSLRRNDGTVFRVPDYFLINEEEEDSKQLLLKAIPPGNYTALEFIIGVDSADNCSGAQSGALDPVNAMYWAWNTGYIFLKLEGNAPASTAPGHFFEYHIGGYKQPCNCIRRVALNLEHMALGAAPQSLELKADILKLLNGGSPINFGTLPTVTDFHNAPLVADNYKNMFSIAASAHEN